jgi:hypothetical protein
MRGNMDCTPFPHRPADVVALSTQEFSFGLDMSGDPSLDVICERFLGDANRALVWMIRFRALRSCWARAEVLESVSHSMSTEDDQYEVAASLDLNDCWEFDARTFCTELRKLVAKKPLVRPE